MEEVSRHMRLRDWLIAQIDSGTYPGLNWENHEKNMFRIPWKHAAKQDYKQNQDAALFKAWAMYKGKFQEGRDRADPSIWKTRLRCALNKSTDFREVPERSQLDISEPYKVYCILDESSRPTDSSGKESESGQRLTPTDLNVPLSDPRSRTGDSDIDPVYNCPSIDPKTSSNSVPRLAHHCSSWVALSDCRLEVRLFYYGILVKKLVTTSPDGCFILQGQAPVGSEHIYGPCQSEKLFFPQPNIAQLPSAITQAMSRLLPHLEKGVLVWLAPDGVFIKRFCQGRVYWNGPEAQHRLTPNKLEREKTCKLLDTGVFLQELQSHRQGTGPEPRYMVELCFGEEFPDPSPAASKKLITAQVIPLFATECFYKHTEADKMKHLPTQQGSISI